MFFFTYLSFRGTLRGEEIRYYMCTKLSSYALPNMVSSISYSLVFSFIFKFYGAFCYSILRSGSLLNINLSKVARSLSGIC